MNVSIILPLIDFIAVAARLAPEVLDAYYKSRDLIKKIVEENREPTLEEHNEINDSINQLRKSLHTPYTPPPFPG